MKKRHEEILNDLGYEVVANNCIKDIKNNTILDQIRDVDGSKYLYDGKEIIRISDDFISFKISSNLTVSNKYKTNMVISNIGSTYNIDYLFPNKDLFNILIDITKYKNTELVATININAYLEKNNKLVNDINYGLVSIEQYSTYANVKYKKGVAHYNNELCNTGLFLTVLEDYLNGINEYRNNKDVWKYYILLIKKYLRKDLDSIFEFRDSNIDMYLNNYNNLLKDMNDNDIRKSLIKKRVSILNNKK